MEFRPVDSLPMEVFEEIAPFLPAEEERGWLTLPCCGEAEMVEDWGGEEGDGTSSTETRIGVGGVWRGEREFEGVEGVFL
jgi:hypothetical protein